MDKSEIETENRGKHIFIIAINTEEKNIGIIKPKLER